MKLPAHKTKIICTIGPASSSPEIIEELIGAGMNVARINLSHGGPAEWTALIDNVRKAAQAAQRVVEIFVDLPGAKIRVGKLLREPLQLARGQAVTLVAGDVQDASGRIPVQYSRLADSAVPGGKIYLDDGFIELRIQEVAGGEVRCSVVAGGPLKSHKGVNLPGAPLHLETVTGRDLELVQFALDHGVETIGISFVTKVEDVLRVRKFAQSRGRQIFAIAKIEVGAAVSEIDGILHAADAIMIARGDLGVEMPIAEVPLIQKKLIAKANLLGRPVITATQMLESMKIRTRPTRAEVSDVANAILDGTDAVMLSEETAAGGYPVETVRMMAAIAAAAEAGRPAMTHAHESLRGYLKTLADSGTLTVPDVISRNAVVAADILNARYIMVPTETGGTPRRVSRYKPGAWILAFSGKPATCRRLQLSYGVYPFLLDTAQNGSSHGPMIKHLHPLGLIAENDQVVIAEGGFSHTPGSTDSLAIIRVTREMMENGTIESR